MSDITRICGKHAVREALQSERPVYKLWLSKSLAPPIFREFQKLARDQNVPVQVVPPQKLNSLLPEAKHQGLIAETGSFDYADWDQWLKTVKEQENPIVVVLDQIQDPHNLGAIVRTAEVAGVAGVIVPRHGAVGISETVAKASAGAIEQVPILQVTNLSRTLEELQKAGLWAMGLDANGGENLYQANLTGPLVLVVGNEHKGLRPNVAKHCDLLLHIPMQAQRSLNASVSTAVALFEAVRQRL